MNKLKEIAFTFACVSTLVLLFSTIYITIFWRDAPLNYAFLWELLGVNALCSIGNLIYPKEAKSKKQLYLLSVIHYVYINLVVLVSGFYFDWFRLDNLVMVISMVVMIAVIFAAVTLILHLYSKKKAAVINERLQEYKRQRSSECDKDQKS